jgi:hypothetical protein
MNYYFYEERNAVNVLVVSKRKKMEKGYLLINSYPLYILGVLLDLEDS